MPCLVLRDFLLGRNSIFIILGAVVIIHLCGIVAPRSFDIISVSKDDARQIASGLWSSYISLLSIALAISAIILAIIQIANRKISITNLLFIKTWYIPLVYYGLMNIAVLTLLQFAYPNYNKVISDYVFVRIVSSSIYSFILFIALTCIVFYKTFRYINFNNLIDDYLSDILKKLARNNNKDLNFLSARAKEVFSEIADAIEKEDNVILEKFMEAIEAGSRINPNSTFLFSVNTKIVQWNLTAYVQGKIDVWATLIASWRKMRVDMVEMLNKNTQYKYSEIPGKVLSKMPSEMLSTATFDYTLHIKELILYTPLTAETPEATSIAFQKSLNYLRDFINVIMALCHRNEVDSLKKAMNQLNQIIDNLESNKNEYEYNLQLQNNPNPFEIAKYNGSTTQLLLIYDAILGISSWYTYIHIHYSSNQSLFKNDIFYGLLERVVNQNSSYSLQQIAFHDLESVIDWREWIWKLEDREDGKAYFIPTKEDIKTYGLLLSYLKYPHLVTPPLYSTFRLNELLVRVKTNRELLNNVLDGDLKDVELEERITKLEAKITESDEIAETEKSIILANSVLSEKKLNDFREIIYGQWANSRNLYSVFHAYGSVETNPEEELMQVGTPRMSLKNGRMLFVDGDEHVPLGNVNWGKEVNRRVEELFSNTIFNSSIPIQNVENIISAFDDAISKFYGGKPENIVAFLPTKFLYKWHVSLINSGNYQHRAIGESTYRFEYQGVYKNKIPVVRFHSTVEKPIAVFINMPNGIKYQQRLNENWKDEQLEISINDLNVAEAEAIINEEPEKYKNITRERAIEILRANLVILVQEVMKFKVIDASSVLIYEINH